MEKILVIGGTGATGRLVRDRLTAAGLEADHSSRGPGSEPGHVRLDLDGPPAEAVDLLARYDWAVACLGPFEVLGDRLHRACLAAGTGLVDVNDGIAVHRRIGELDRAARDAGVRLLTGFGLCPGLSTAQLHLAGRAVADPRRAETRLRIAGGQASGPAAVRSMFRTMREPHRTLRDGAEVAEPRGPVADDGYIGYENPDLDLVRRLWPGIREYEYLVRFDALPPRQVDRLRTSRLFTLGVLEERLARMGARAATRTARRADPADLEPTVLRTMVHGAGGASAVITATGAGSYAMTADFAAAALREALAGPPAPGVHDPATDPGFTGRVLDRASAAGDLTIDIHQEEQ